MAKLKIYAATGEYQYLPNLYDQGSLATSTHTSTEFILEDANGMKIIFAGTEFKYKAGVPDSGKISTVTFENSDGDTLAKYTDGKYNFGGLKEPGILNDIWWMASFLNAGNDIVTGSALGDDLFAGNNGGNDIIRGLGGDDYIKGFAGNNTYDGGSGFDTLTYDESVFDKAHAKKGLILDVADGTARNPWGGTDHFKNMEEYRGSYLADKITGSKAEFEQFMGLGGADVINGGKGTDRLRYDRDEHYGGDDGITVDLSQGTIVDGFGKTDKVSGIEQIVGSHNDDSFTGDKHGNKFRGLDGADSYNGKGGQDAVSFYTNSPDHGINIDMTLTSGQVIDDGFGNTETLVSIEGIEGTSLADTIALGAANGYAYGDSGNDTLTSGEGKHYLEGADDADKFVFLTASGIGAKSGAHDVIADFSQTDDETIDLSAVATMDFIGTDNFNNMGGAELRYEVEGNKTFVYGDTNGNGTTDFALELRGVYTLTEDDFILT
jgi:Ca2+-binding RTX toxin-like protein